jgi:hypothetical protein
MEQKKNNEQKADVSNVSQPIAKPHVVRSFSNMSNFISIRELDTSLEIKGSPVCFIDITLNYKLQGNIVNKKRISNISFLSKFFKFLR